MKFQLIAEWKSFYKMYSVWFMVILGMLPEIHNALIASGLFEGTEIGELFSTLTKAVAFFGVMSRLIQQAKVEVARQQALANQA
jgi:hypothetical protein